MHSSNSFRGALRMAMMVVVLAITCVTLQADPVVVFDRVWPPNVNPLPVISGVALSTNPTGEILMLTPLDPRITTFDRSGRLVLSQLLDDPVTPFDSPEGFTVDTGGNLWIADTGSYRVVKLSPNGTVLLSFGSPGTGAGEFDLPVDVAVDASGHVYVVDQTNNRIQKFKPNGQYLTEWGGLNDPSAVTVGPTGNIYVSDFGSDSIQKFDPDGNFIASSGFFGTGDGEFHDPRGIAFDSAGFIFVVDTLNHRVQKLDANATYFDQFGSQGQDDGQFDNPTDVVVDAAGYVYVKDAQRIQKFTNDGSFMTSWGQASTVPGRFRRPYGIAVNSQGYVFVSEFDNDRIQAFNPSGNYIASIGSGTFDDPFALAIDNSDNIFVVDHNNHFVHRIAWDNTTFFGSITSWGTQGSGNGQFEFPEAIATDSAGNFYVSDTGNDRIQKFDSSGNHAANFPVASPKGLGLDSSGNIYVVEGDNDRVVKLNAAGTPILNWGTTGTNPGEFNNPIGLTVHNDEVYVVDQFNDRIQHFDANGTYIDQWGGEGNAPGEFAAPWALAFDSSGEVYVTDVDNNRLQRFSVEDDNDEVSRAIVIMGGGPFEGNRLWPATAASGSLARWALGIQGFNTDNILVLSPDAGQALGGDGGSDVYGHPTPANLQYAFTDWALDTPVDVTVKDVVVYLVDHGAPGRFRLTEDDILDEGDLAGWLDTLQAGITGNLIIIYDACESGSFMDAVANPTYAGRRIFMSSTSNGEQAYFVENGLLSFSNTFWINVLNSFSVGASFTSASTALQWANQNPVLDDDCDGAPDGPGDRPLADATYIGVQNTGVVYAPSANSPGSDGTIAGVNNGTIWIDNVIDFSGIARVWAVITPPTYAPAASTLAVIGRSEIDLVHTGGTHWEAEYPDFVTEGVYSVSIFVTNALGNVSGPYSTTITVGTPPTRKAIIVTGGDAASAEWDSYAWAASWINAALTIQGYADDDINFLSQASGNGIDNAAATLSDVETAIQTWGTTNTRDLTICFVGQGTLGGMWINPSEFLAWTDLGTWLDAIRPSVPGVITVYCDVDGAASMLPQTIPGTLSNQIVIASASGGEPAAFESGGVVSFTRYFWVETALGANVAAAFRGAATAMSVANGQHAAIDDNGNGVYETKTDGLLAANYSIGTGIGLAGDEPVIGDVAPVQILTGNQISANIWVENVTTLLALKEVVATISPPGGGDPVALPLADDGNGRWEATYNGFTQYGTYDISVTAIDLRDVASAPAVTQVIKVDPNGATPDAYESDNSADTFGFIGVDGFPDQRHTFHADGDVDWVQFYATQNDSITIETNNLGDNVDTYLMLFRDDGVSFIADNDDRPIGDVSSSLTWTVDTSGFYLVRVSHSDASALPGFGEGTEYDLRVWRQSGPTLPGNLVVNVMTPQSAPIPAATIALSSLTPPWSVQQATRTDGTYPFNGLATGSYQITVSATGYSASAPVNVVVSAGATTVQPVTLQPQPGTITCTITPAAAITAGAQWRIDGGAWLNSGTTATGLTPGSHIVTFKSIAGWQAPGGLNVNVSSNENAITGGTYQLVQLDTPQGLVASDGTFTDRVALSWNSVPNATGYRVYRSQSWDGATGVAIGDSTGTAFDDTTALAATVTVPPGGCGGGGGEPEINYVPYVYWVQALGAAGAVSGWSNPNDGYRGADLKAMPDLWAGLYTFETALPPRPIDKGVNAALPDEVIALRIWGDSPIDPASLAGAAESDDGEVVPLVWVASTETSGWAVASPMAPWKVGAMITINASALTIEGERVEVSHRFHIVPGVDGVPSLPDGDGQPVFIESTGPSATAKAWALTGNESSILYYYVSSGPHTGWQPADRVQGFLESVDGDAIYVRHGGWVQFGPPPASAPVPSGFQKGAGQMVTALLLLFTLLIASRTIRRVHA